MSHAYAPESHYMMLPRDRSGMPIHVGDRVRSGFPWCVDSLVKGVTESGVFIGEKRRYRFVYSRNVRVVDDSEA